MGKVSPYRDKLVYIRKTWGSDRGHVDDSQLYRVKQCGPKMATLVRVDKTTLQPNGWRGRGSNYYLHTKEEAEHANRNGHGFHYWDWSQFFVPQGEAGWDPDMNF